MTTTSPRPAWPTREEWQADAEHHVRRECLAAERVPNGAEHYLSAAALAERDRLRVAVARSARPRLTTEIKRLRALPGDSEAARLVELESCRRLLTRFLRDGTVTAAVYGNPFAWSALEQVADPGQLARIRELGELHQQRLADAAEAATLAAIEREVERRQTDEAWQRELERRERVDHGVHVVNHTLSALGGAL